MVKEYPKGHPIKLSEYFVSTEFDCRCTRPGCLITLLDTDLAEGVDLIRHIVGPILVKSGYRCAAHNADPSVGGAPSSQHLLGKAADIKSLSGLSGRQLEAVALKIGYFINGGIGTASTWIHVDVRGKKARWQYPIPHS